MPGKRPTPARSVPAGNRTNDVPGIEHGDLSNMKLLNVCFIALAFLVFSAEPAFAQDTHGGGMPKAVGAGLGCGITILGLGLGLGRVGGSALESMARQPEVSDKVVTNMLIIAALVEGAAVISLVFCFLTLLIG